MKYNGYTLAEVLVCLCIIGVLAAILLPLANKFKPDSTKAIYVKTYDALVTLTRDIASNPVLYPLTYEDGNKIIDYSKAPLYNFIEVSVGQDSDGNVLTYGGDAAKFCQLLAIALPQSLNSKVSCSASSISYSDSLFNTPSFTTVQGMQYVLGTDTDGSTKYQTDIYIDLNGEQGNNCLYDSKECKKPDRFKFIVSGDGHVIPADPMGQEYLATRMNWRKTDITPDAVENKLISVLPEEWQQAPAVSEKPKTDNGGDEEPDNPAKLPEDDDGIDIGLYSPVACINYESFGNCLSSSLEIADQDLPQKYNWQDAQDQCAAIGMRVPTLNELYTIYKNAKEGLVEGTTGTEYWTSTGYSKDSSKAQNGIVGGSYWSKGVQSKSTARQVRCVK